MFPLIKYCSLIIETIYGKCFVYIPCSLVICDVMCCCRVPIGRCRVSIHRIFIGNHRRRFSTGSVLVLKISSSDISLDCKATAPIVSAKRPIHVGLTKNDYESAKAKPIRTKLCRKVIFHIGAVNLGIDGRRVLDG